MIAQTWAMALDAYRELHARKLFWITLVLSGLVVLGLAAVGIDDKGVQIVTFTIESEFLNTQYIPVEDFYRSIFVEFGLKLWLTWIAAILALISTAGIFPELITGGSIDLWLSRPISRWRLFITKFLLGLAFVFLQVTVFTLGCFLVLGLRGGVWEPALFLAVPVVTLFFAYLFAICVLFGVLTRSTIAALLLTLLAWTAIGLVNMVEGGLLLGRSALELELRSIERDEARATESGGERAAEPSTELPSQLSNGLSTELSTEQSTELGKERARTERIQGVVAPLHFGAFVLKTLLPKTDETIELLNRAMIDLASMPSPPPARPGARGMFGSRRVSDDEVARAMAERLHDRPVLWVLGTSLLFTVATVGLAGWVFCRRDY